MSPRAATAVRARRHRRAGRDVRPGPGRRPRRHRRAGRPRRRQPGPDGRAQPAGWPSSAPRRCRRTRPTTSPRCSTRSGSTSVLVTTVDGTHDEYIVAALDAGRDVDHREADDHRRRRAAGASSTRSSATGRRVTVAFNYRYNPVHEQVRELLAAGAIGEIGSVHFEWLLDVRHGADYFRRWHRDKANSGGLLVHKASHHFDLVNWWLGAAPARCSRQGGCSSTARTAAGTATPATTTGRTAPRRPPATRSRCAWPTTRGCASSTSTPRPRTATTATATSSRPASPSRTTWRCWSRYATGATMTYHLTAYAPWEGYRVMVNGSRGRLELEVVESDHVAPGRRRRGQGRRAARRRGAGRARLVRADRCARSGRRRGEVPGRRRTSAAATAAPTPG